IRLNGKKVRISKTIILKAIALILYQIFNCTHLYHLQGVRYNISWLLGPFLFSSKISIQCLEFKTKNNFLSPSYAHDLKLVDVVDEDEFD
ncbi:hypothetical protein BpHYR1_023174, partial [Brachionus plicatilis]